MTRSSTPSSVQVSEETGEDPGRYSSTCSITVQFLSAVVVAMLVESRRLNTKLILQVMGPSEPTLFFCLSHDRNGSIATV
jgi:hypothetical protein